MHHSIYTPANLTTFINLDHLNLTAATDALIATAYGVKTCPKRQRHDRESAEPGYAGR